MIDELWKRHYTKAVKGVYQKDIQSQRVFFYNYIIGSEGDAMLIGGLQMIGLFLEEK